MTVKNKSIEWKQPTQTEPLAGWETAAPVTVSVFVLFRAHIC